MVSKRVIRDKKELYGNNFEEASIILQEEFGLVLYPEEIAKVLAAIKQSRLKYLTEILKNRDAMSFEEINKYADAAADTKVDLYNYMWISDNYEEYLELDNK